ncbi:MULTISPECIES: aspartate/glutamate racemase family protein [Clostridium]|jgi:aspartate racemase|uniref:Aspartate/glutamate racemase family protein n=1 Tax=Clostridium lapidicellarium TaxID=3240931 RepID=A0ABV4E0V2_9CLOT|nr:amino acid racemase [uncultured Clostridium sp.]NLU07531.1 amino acid racemase [Clostridiales bacterium]
MKKLGLIGGIGPESTIPYYHDIVYGVQSKVGGNFFPNLTIESLNVFDVLGMCDRKEYEALVNYLMSAINNLKASGVDFIALTGNTPHIVFDELQERSSIPIISIIQATCDETKRRNISKVGLLGTIFTMDGEFFKKPFENNNIEVVIPNDEEKRFVNQKISQELELGIVKEETLSSFLKIVQRMKDENGIQAIVLGCTELPLLFKGVRTPVDCLDTMQIHIQTLINMIVG